MLRSSYFTLFLFFLFLSGLAHGSKAPQEQEVQVQLPSPIIQGVEQEVTLIAEGKGDGREGIRVNGDHQELEFQDGKARFIFDFKGPPLSIEFDGERIERSYSAVPLWTSLLPPIIAIALALILREVLVSLFAGIFLGAAITACYSTGWTGIFVGLFTAIDTYILGALNDSGHLSVILFSMMIGAVVALISSNGGMQGIVDRIARWARSAVSGQMSTWALGIAIFFDDYANTLVVGNTMRPVTDRLRISREKLAYLVDSTAAPIAAVAFITTWIGAELGYIQDAIETISNKSGEDIGYSAYGIFLNSLAYSFYPIFSLLFIPFLILQRRDFGPMWKAEKLARKGEATPGKGGSNGDGEQDSKAYTMIQGLKPNAWFALLPIATIILGTFTGLLYTGKEAAFQELSEAGVNSSSGFAAVWGQLQQLDGVPDGSLGKLGALIGRSDAYASLLWSSMGALTLSVLMTVLSGRMKLVASIESLLSGFRSMLSTMIVLILAWSLAQVTQDMHTAEMMTSLMGDSVAPWAVPSITFLLSAAVAFSTGSSWGTMAILYPLMLPLSWSIGMEGGIAPDRIMPLFFNVTSCVLAGAVLGDHCSPISDTTILSSLASSCDHIEHVRTQLPYALTVGSVALLIGTLPASLGLPFWISFLVGGLLLFGIVRLLGKRVEG